MADNLNIKNPSVTEGELDLRTDASGNIVSISGHSIAGGAGGGNVYFGDDEYIQFKTGTTNTFTLTDGVKDTINHIPQIVSTEVSRISYTKNDIDDRLDDKQDKLTFEYDEDNKVSAINGSALAGQGGTTYTPGQYINIDLNNEISVTGVVAADEYSTYSGDWNDVSNSYKTNSGSFLTSEDLTQYSTIEHANDASANAFNQATALIPDVSNFITKDVDNLTNYYKKTQTSSDSELAEAFGSILKYNVTAAAGIEVTTATDAGVKTYGISMTAQPVVTDTRLSGYNGVAAEPDGNVSGLWDVGLTQDMLNTINGKLDSTEAAQTYLEKATYASDSATFLTKTSADNDYAPKTITATVNTLTGASAKWENASNVVATNSANWNAKVDQSVLNDYLTKAQYQTDSATFALKTQLDDYYKKTDTSSKTELNEAFGSKQDNLTQEQLSAISSVSSKLTQDKADTLYAPISVTGDVDTLKSSSGDWNNVSAKLDASVASTTYQTKADMEGYLTKSEASTTYQPTGNYLVANDIIGKLDKSIYANASGNWENTYNVVNQYSAAGTWLTAHQSLTNYYTKSETSGAIELSTEFGKYALKSEIPIVPTKVSDLTDSANYYKTTETSSKNELTTEFTKYLTNTQYNTDSATFALKTDLNDLVSSASITTEADYVMTTAGWKVLTLPGGGMTQVIHDETLTGQGNDANSKLSVAWSALSGNTINSAKSAGSATSALSANKADSAYVSKRLQDSTSGPVIQVGDVTALQNWASSNSSTWDGVTAKLGTAQYANDSATFVTKPDTTQTDLNNNYLIYSTLTGAGTTTGWMPLSANYYSKTEADGRYQKILDMGNYLTTAQYETDSAKFVTSSSNTITGTKQYALTTTGWASVETAYLPLSGGTVSGTTTISGSNFDSTLEVKRAGQDNNYAHIGLNNSRGLSFKAFDDNASTNVQFDMLPNNSNSAIIRVQHNGSAVGNLIPAVTATTTAGLTNDGILHIILES